MSKQHDLHVKVRDLAKAHGLGTKPGLKVEAWVEAALKIDGVVIGTVGQVWQAFRLMEMIPVDTPSPWAIAKKKASTGKVTEDKKPAAGKGASKSTPKLKAA